MKFPRTWDLIFTNKVSRKKKESNSYPSKSLQSVFKTGIGICVFQKKPYPMKFNLNQPTNTLPPKKKPTNQTTKQKKPHKQENKTKQNKIPNQNN